MNMVITSMGFVICSPLVYVPDILRMSSHAAHHILAIYSLGASPEIIEEAYKTHGHLKPLFKSPEPITNTNFIEHLGDSQ